MAKEYPALVSIENYGKSSEGRPMKVMKISTGGVGSKKPSVWLDGGIHGKIIMFNRFMAHKFLKL